MNDLFGNIVERAIDRIKEFEPEEGYYVAYSGGKDSDTILNLVRMSGVKYDAHHHLTTCDPPELVQHVKAQPDVVIGRPKMTMWELIVKRQMPPRRQARFCCQELKEGGGSGRIVVTGVRWGESARRSKRRMVEACMRDKSKHYFHPIIDWKDTEVWDFIRSNNIEYCKLYDEGFKRLGCVLCPMTRDVELQMKRWPQIARAWERAVKKTYNSSAKKKFKSAEEYWQWWLDRDRPSMLKADDDQMMFFED